MLSEANFLILDEPTNHLDIMSKEILEDAINAYTGTVLYVSHDRYFINKTASRILDLNHKVLTNYLGNYEYYLEKKEEQLSPTTAHIKTPLPHTRLRPKAAPLQPHLLPQLQTASRTGLHAKNSRQHSARKKMN